MSSSSQSPAAARPSAATTPRTLTSPTTIPPPRHSTPSSYPSPRRPLISPQSTNTTNPRPQNPNSNNFYLNPQFHRPNDLFHPVVSSGGGGFAHRAPHNVRHHHPSDQIANPGGGGGGAVPPRSGVMFAPQMLRNLGFSNSHSDNSQAHMIRQPYVQPPNLGVNSGPGAGLTPIREMPVHVQPKVASSPSMISDSNGYKDLRSKRRADALVTIRDRKVRITEGASLYALCRSWLRNGRLEESQPVNEDGRMRLPRPIPAHLSGSFLPTRNEVEEYEENEEAVQHLSAEELLQRHIVRARRVRARLREERAHRIDRYKTRLAMLLPAQVEQIEDDAEP